MILLPLALAEPLPGRDFWPAVVDVVDFIAPPTEDDETWFAADSLWWEETLWVYIFHENALYLGTYDLESGALDIDTSAPLLAPTGVSGTPDESAVTNVAVQPCHPATRVDVSPEWDATDGVCRLPDLGVDSDSVVVEFQGPEAAGCSCSEEEEATPVGDWSLVTGLDDGTRRTTDGLVFADGVDGCENLLVSYEYTSCSLGDDAWRCPVEGGLGVCRWFMMWESEGDIDGANNTPVDRVINLAHAPIPTGPWIKWAEDGRTELTVEDIRVKLTGPHMPDDQWTKLSFASVPDLWYDESDGVWRMWITGEAGSGSAMWYADSPDDGLSWGITEYARTIDCWDDTAKEYDTTACARVEWEIVPPDDEETSREPDAVDFCVYDYPHSEPGHVAVMFTAANASCEPAPHAGAFLFGDHPDGGDQSGGVLYSWHSSVEADAETGLVVAFTRSGVCDTVLHDFNIAQTAEDTYVMFFTQVPPNGVHVSGSGWQCSNFVDDDGDGAIDYGPDDGCLSPTDDTE